MSTMPFGDCQRTPYTPALIRRLPTTTTQISRIVLTSGALVFSNLASMTVFVLAVSIVTLIFEEQAKPHVNSYLGAFTYCMAWEVVLCVLAMLLLDAEMTSDAGETLIGVSLLLINACMMIVVLWDTKATEKRMGWLDNVSNLPGQVRSSSRLCMLTRTRRHTLSFKFMPPATRLTPHTAHPGTRAPARPHTRTPAHHAQHTPTLRRTRASSSTTMP